MFRNITLNSKKSKLSHNLLVSAAVHYLFTLHILSLELCCLEAVRYFFWFHLYGTNFNSYTNVGKITIVLRRDGEIETNQPFCLSA